MHLGATTMVAQGLLIGAALLLLAAALHDIATRTVPNWISVAILAAGLGVRVLEGGLWLGLLAALIVFSAAAFCWRRGWMGGADVKLLAASALIVKPGLVLGLLLAVSLAGGAMIGIYAVLHGLVRLSGPRRAGERPATLFARICRVERRRIRRFESFPYASAIAAGALFVLFSV